ncbi:DUF6691 family protein [Polycladidibacter stylochi]|uniref:DUF6691 family protein n=1 Tax=Polycladidibacter stylochi TaxID=1807766 RepID=UPI000833D218|nr:DUF6691 family protein [Pseudovibrio stylochi]
MLRAFYGLLAGLSFGAGLTIADMINPAKVQNFLDIAGNWDPSLAFVMGGAIVVAFPFFRLAQRMGTPLACDDFRLPTKIALDNRLIIGSGLFGIGWGLGGLCPGPAISALTIATSSSFFVFAIAMAVGMILARIIMLRA